MINKTSKIANEAEFVRASMARNCGCNICLIGACVQDAYTQAASQGKRIGDLFDGNLFNFSYYHGTKCRKAYLAVRERMLAEVRPEDLAEATAQLDEKIQELLENEEKAQDIARELFAPYADTANLLSPARRKAPAKGLPAPSPGPAEPVPALRPGEEHPRRARTLQEWAAITAPLDVFVRDLAPVLTHTDRTQLAEQLEALARAMKATQSMRPARTRKK